jgi:dienelactone hydrolase
MEGDTSSRFDLQRHVDGMTRAPERRLAFDGKTLADFERWQGQLRCAVKGLLGLEGRTIPHWIPAERLARVERPGYCEEKFVLDVGEGVKAPVYLLIPDRAPPFKSVLVFHGHNPSVQYVLGNYPDETVAGKMLARQMNYAQALAQAGYLVCAVEQRGFGERQSTQYPDAARSCRHLAFNYLMAGRTLLGERIWDGLCAIQFLDQRPDIVRGALGCTGNSGGGTTSLWLSALDERITTCVPSCAFSSFYASIGSIWHCECNYVPGILDWADMGDLAALIAPRPLCIISGQEDDIFPIQAARAQFRIVEGAYALHEAKVRCTHAVHPDGHRYDQRLSLDFFSRWL